MKKIFFFCLYLAIFSSLLASETSEEKRRVEQEKRDSLQPTEVQRVKEKEIAPQIGPLDIAYFTDLMLKRVTFRYDACKALVILMGVGEQYLDLDSQIAFLRDKNLLPKKYELEFNPMEPLRKGLFAYMFCKALEIKGGVSLRLFGLSERYALKELAFAGIASSGNVNDIVSGQELILAIIQASDYRARKQGLSPLKLKE